jgi:hypothetical protein
VKVLLDEDLRRFETVCAAAGTPFAVFALRPDQLRSLTGADWTDVKQLDPMAGSGDSRVGQWRVRRGFYV